MKRLICTHSYNSKSRYRYTMPCEVLKSMPGERVKILVFGNRWDNDMSISRIRYVDKHRIVE